MQPDSTSPSHRSWNDPELFVGRHLGPDDDEVAAMCSAVGVSSPEALMADALPPAIVDDAPPAVLGAARSEHDVLAELRTLAGRNRPRTSLIGMGYTGTITPPVIRRNLLEDPAWYTAYTPYQPEISQGRLEALVNFQTAVTELTGRELANASLLDEATAAAEAMTMARRRSRVASDRFFVHADTHPQTVAVVRTRAEPIGVEVVVGDDDALDDGEFVGALFSNPGSTGRVRDLTAQLERAAARGTVTIVATDLLACAIVQPPGEMGADIVIGSAQRFGVPMGFGGPHAAFIAVREDMARLLPGRLVGVSVDAEGRPALRLALQTREQHIRRERATSNICTAQVLLANIAGMYAVWHGPDGLRAIAERVHRLTSDFVTELRAAGGQVVNDTWFDTIVVTGIDARAIHERARDQGLDLRRIDHERVGLTFDEMSSLDLLSRLRIVFGLPPVPTDTVVPPVPAIPTRHAAVDGLPPALRRTTGFCSQAVFHRHRTEHEMLRYLRRLSDRDLALDRTMIPLGSCTMKLNATAEMVPITWPEFADLHPFAPEDTSEGSRALVADLERSLAGLTGYDAVSLQPNAGSQGEFAGLLAIRAYHRSRGDLERTVCVIPESAHGTNAASAVMAGFDVAVVACDERGDVDLDDLRSVIERHAGRIGAIMVTYPSTHGVYEDGIAELCRLVHDAGGQVYVDGANLNALVGWSRPGAFGADVSHLNLHKTFCIPHGGGGPGVGPVAVRSHLTPFLPGHPLGGDDQPVGPVSAAPFGSAGILPIPWVYLALMGDDGIRRATAVAVLAANYVAARLQDAFPVLYRGRTDRVAHECIVDLRPLTKATGVTVDDVAKRLIDHGFHAPTVSFPVAGTLMIEPTESESLAELDRFCDAMWSIRSEIDRVADGTWSIEESPLRHAPHTLGALVGPWERAYPRALGAAPGGIDTADRYLPPVARIDAAAGDRNLVCSCEPLEAYAAASRATVAG